MQSMKWKNTLIMFVLLALAASWYFIAEVDRQKKKDEEKAHSKHLLPYGAGEVDSVTFRNPAGEVIGWKRKNGGWLITSPAIADADPSAIDYLLEQMIPGNKKSEFEAMGKFADYGLESPYATIILFNGSRGRTDTLGIGDKTPLTDQCYVRLGSSPMIVVTREFTRNLVRKNLYHLRDKRFLHVSPDSITGLAIGTGASSASFEKHLGTWLVSGTRMGADKSLIEPYITSLTEAIIRDFPSEDAGDARFFGIGSPSKKITLLSGKDTITISFGREEEGLVYAVRSGLDKVVRIERKYLQIFDWLPEELMIFNLASFVPGEITRIAWNTPGSNLILVSDASGWRILDDPGARIDKSEVDYFLMILRGLSFHGICGEKNPGPFQEKAGNGSLTGSVRIVLSDSSGTVVDDITVTRLDDGTEYGMSSLLSSSGIVKKDSVAELKRIVSRILARSGE